MDSAQMLSLTPSSPVLEAEFDRLSRTQPRPLGEADWDKVRRLAEQVPAVWHAPTMTPADRRQIVRLLVDRVVLTVEPSDERMTVRLEWSGGAVRNETFRRPYKVIDNSGTGRNCRLN